MKSWWQKEFVFRLVTDRSRFFDVRTCTYTSWTRSVSNRFRYRSVIPRSLTILITGHSKYEITVPLTWRSVIQWIRSVTPKVTIIGAENPTPSPSACFPGTENNVLQNVFPFFSLRSSFFHSAFGGRCSRKTHYGKKTQRQ